MQWQGVPYTDSSKQHEPPTDNHLTAVQQEPHRSLSNVLYLLTKNVGKFSEKQQQKDQVNGPWAENGQDRKGNRTRQKNKRGDRKGESNDSPEIPDRR